jgi:hypothetical protein
MLSHSAPQSNASCSIFTPLIPSGHHHKSTILPDKEWIELETKFLEKKLEFKLC